MAPTNSIGINQIMSQLSAVIQLQAAHARRDELRTVPRLEGFEGVAKVKEFFDSFEDATLGCTSQERTKLLRQKCRNRAQHLVEDLLETVGSHYDALKVELIAQITGASTEREEAMQKLSQGVFRYSNESLSSFSGRITATVKSAFPEVRGTGLETLYNHYFTRGLTDVQLFTALSSLHDLSYQQRVAQAVKIKAQLNTVRGAQPNTLNWMQQNPGSAENRSSNERFILEKRRNYGDNPTFPNHDFNAQEHESRIPPRAVAESPNFTRSGERNRNQAMNTIAPYDTPKAHYLGSMSTIANADNERNINILRRKPTRNRRCRRNSANEPQSRFQLKDLLPTMEIIVNGTPCSGLVNTGASVSVLSRKNWDRVKTNSAKLKPPEHECIAANGQILKIIGETLLSVEYGERVVKNVCFVVSADPVEEGMLISAGLLHQLGFMFHNRFTGEDFLLPSLCHSDHKRTSHILSSVRKRGSKKLDSKLGNKTVIGPPNLPEETRFTPTSLGKGNASFAKNWRLPNNQTSRSKSSKNATESMILLRSPFQTNALFELQRTLLWREQPSRHRRIS
ncbi:hypothetical protein L596_025315 [Steinernema carpocapsae]|uniref:Peptidase A2 domain-containing protein n=1 Tax=Steinernema carpocapsae TaxID=34508 RepID=A0A4U5M7E9_STECR|nr:hypothetical protein L596_025315 [Steinernema carpocapsae]